MCMRDRCAAVLEIARVLSELKLRRTVKAICFGVEEFGLCFGSFAYVEKHADELPKIRAVVTMDGGGNPYDLQFELMATEDIRSFAFNVAKEAGYDVKCEIDPLPLSDHVPFQAHGVPTAWLWGGALSMFYHTAKDDPETLDYDKCKQ